MSSCSAYTTGPDNSRPWVQRGVRPGGSCRTLFHRPKAGGESGGRGGVVVKPYSTGTGPVGKAVRGAVVVVKPYSTGTRPVGRVARRARLLADRNRSAYSAELDRPFDCRHLAMWASVGVRNGMLRMLGEMWLKISSVIVAHVIRRP